MEGTKVINRAVADNEAEMDELLKKLQAQLDGTDPKPLNRAQRRAKLQGAR